MFNRKKKVATEPMTPDELKEEVVNRMKDIKRDLSLAGKFMLIGIDSQGGVHFAVSSDDIPLYRGALMVADQVLDYIEAKSKVEKFDATTAESGRSVDTGKS